MSGFNSRKIKKAEVKSGEVKLAKINELILDGDPKMLAIINKLKSQEVE